VKLPGAFTLGEAHAAVEQVEAAIRRDVPQVRFVHTHIEPLALTGEAVAPAGDEVAQARRVIDEVVRGLTGQTPGVIEFRDAGEGRVALVEVSLPADASLSVAHERAGAIEHAVRQRCPELADVIVHTEPVATSGE